jgi:hypothetical protein
MLPKGTPGKNPWRHRIQKMGSGSNWQDVIRASPDNRVQVILKISSPSRSDNGTQSHIETCANLRTTRDSRSGQ